MSEIVNDLKWEDLKVYKPLTKEELKPALKEFTQIIAKNLKPFGFALYGRKLIRLSNDIFQIIHLDTRGSWSGNTEYFKIKIALIAVSDKSPFLRGVEPSGEKPIEEIVKGIRNHYRITKEYPLLCEYLSRVIIEKVLPYFEEFDKSSQILKRRDLFKLDNPSEGNNDLILFCELQNQVDFKASEIADKTLKSIESINSKSTAWSDFKEEFELYRKGLANNYWHLIDQKLESNKVEIFKKLKIKQFK